MNSKITRSHYSFSFLWASLSIVSIFNKLQLSFVRFNSPYYFFRCTCPHFSESSTCSGPLFSHVQSRFIIFTIRSYLVMSSIMSLCLILHNSCYGHYIIYTYIYLLIYLLILKYYFLRGIIHPFLFMCSI